MGSLHNELTGRSGFLSRAIRNALQIENPEVGVERLSETLTPTMNLWGQPEWALLRGERLWSVVPSGIGVAGQFTQLGVSNPNTSKNIVVVEELAITTTGNVVWEAMLGANVAFTSTSTVNTRDTRTVLLVGCETVSFVHNAAARIGSGALVWSAAIGGQTYSRYRVDVVLSPGFFFAVGPSTVNTAGGVMLIGRERPAFAGELTARA